MGRRLYSAAPFWIYGRKHMRKFNYASSVLVVIFIPLMILILSSNLVLRLSETYVYHFNDSRATAGLAYNVTGSEFADEIAGYWSSFGGEFQVYDDNGSFSDPIFDDSEVEAMAKAKNAVNLHLLAGIISGAVGIVFYTYLYRRGYRKALRKRGFLAAGITAALIVVQDIMLGTGSFRKMLYETFIGVSLDDNSPLTALLGSPFYKTFIIFSSVLGAAMLGIFIYIHFNLTKAKRIFY